MMKAMIVILLISYYGIDITTSTCSGKGISPKGSTRDIIVPVGDTCKGTTSKRLKLYKDSGNDNDSSDNNKSSRKIYLSSL